MTVTLKTSTARLGCSLAGLRPSRALPTVLSRAVEIRGSSGTCEAGLKRCTRPAVVAVDDVRLCASCLVTFEASAP